MGTIHAATGAFTASQKTNMKTAVLCMLILFGATSAFIPIAVRPLSVTSSKLHSEPANRAQDAGELDLDLEDMFDMFDAAEKEQSFDDALEKVKGEGK